LFNVFRRIPATLFCIISDRENSNTNTETKSIDVILRIFAASFI
jgi:hypothetical protein